MITIIFTIALSFFSIDIQNPTDTGNPGGPPPIIVEDDLGG